MLIYIKRFFAFLLPIIGKASVQAAADALADAAYGPRKRQYTAYNRIPRSQPRTYSPSRDAAVRDGNPFSPGSPNWNRYNMGLEPLPKYKPEPFHDVLMIAFDITGPNQVLAEEFLMNYMPLTGDTVFKGEKFNLDAWWIADDGSTNSDCDSAVFVRKGSQDEARRILREHGLVD